MATNKYRPHTVEYQYSLDETVYLLRNERIVKGTVLRIHISIAKVQDELFEHVTYDIKLNNKIDTNTHEYEPEYLYLSPQELAEALISDIE